MPRWTHVIVHHSATEDNTTLADTAAIRRFHTSYRHYGDIITEEKYQELKREGAEGLSTPWRDIGYPWLAERLDGHPTIIRGRSMMMHGAHCTQQGMNRRGIGFCVVGNYDEAPPPEDVFELSAEFVSWLCRMYRIPVENVHPHRDYATYKTCPGKAFDMVYFRERVADYLKAWNPPG